MVKFYSSLIMKKTCVRPLGKQPRVVAVFLQVKLQKWGGEREIINGHLLYLPGEIILMLGAKGMCLRKKWRK